MTERLPDSRYWAHSVSTLAHGKSCAITWVASLANPASSVGGYLNLSAHIKRIINPNDYLHTAQRLYLGLVLLKLSSFSSEEHYLVLSLTVVTVAP
jgi:hypothetical protein